MKVIGQEREGERIYRILIAVDDTDEAIQKWDAMGYILDFDKRTLSPLMRIQSIIRMGGAFEKYEMEDAQLQKLIAGVEKSSVEMVWRGDAPG